jgi:hypothetical protein
VNIEAIQDGSQLISFFSVQPPSTRGTRFSDVILHGRPPTIKGKPSQAVSGESACDYGFFVVPRAIFAIRPVAHCTLRTLARQGWR